MSRRSSHRHSEGASKRLDSTVAAEQEDVLAELLGLLAGGSSHWYTLNGDPFAKTSLCKMLGFSTTRVINMHSWFLRSWQHIGWIKRVGK